MQYIRLCSNTTYCFIHRGIRILLLGSGYLLCMWMLGLIVGCRGMVQHVARPECFFFVVEILLSVL